MKGTIARPCRQLPSLSVRPLRRISEWLARTGIARSENESLIATFSRALGVTLSDVSVYLQRRAAGQHAELATDKR